MTPPVTLADVRVQIDAVDRRLVRLLAERQRLVEQAAAIKGLPDAVHDPVRVAQVFEKVHATAAAAGLSPAIAGPIWQGLIACCTFHQITWLSRTKISSRCPHQ
ncbi:MAG TPA: chorismate mutase [Brevundimonas sp.]|uniref:chorismate mutase n=1 Tax=Brevundimonas sp. TaxID=1871086 RepID=UPI00260C47DE|nr:chorismate mutase [Brevundimonas sp.]HRO32075.1 chorismate mutase [Brevundimonas sp.]